MTAAAPARYCDKCETTNPVKHMKTTVPGTKPVALSLCKCDFGTCRACHEPLPWSVRRCPHCNTGC